MGNIKPFDNPALEYAAQIAYSSREVLNFTYEKAKEYADKPGVYVEAGVAAGSQIIAMLAGAKGKKVHAFDSFEGIPLPSNKDNQMPGIRFLKEWEQKSLPDPGKQELISSGATVVSIEAFTEHIVNAFNGELEWYENLFCHKGWFELTVPYNRYIIEPIALLRLDGDLYNSTFVCLRYLYPKVIEGGLVIVDDWALPGCREAVHDYFEGKLPRMEFIKGKDYCVAHWIK